MTRTQRLGTTACLFSAMVFILPGCAGGENQDPAALAAYSDMISLGIGMMQAPRLSTTCSRTFAGFQCQ